MTLHLCSRRKRIVWVHVDLPGQEDNASVLQIQYRNAPTSSPDGRPSLFFFRKYPSLDEVAHELILILDRLNIARAVLFGEGAGANIACRFALKYPARVHGLVLVHPTGTTTGFIDMIKNKINQRKLINNGMNADAAAYLIEHRFGRVRCPRRDGSHAISVRLTSERGRCTVVRREHS